MRKNLITSAIVLTLAGSALAATGVLAQDEEPEPTLPPRACSQFGNQLTTEVITSALADSNAGQAIVTGSREGHAGVCGVPRRFSAKAQATSDDIEDAVTLLALEDEPPGIIVVNGGSDSILVRAAGVTPRSYFIDIDRPVPCVTLDGVPDPSGTCAGGIESLPFNYSAVTFAVDEGAYLAGMVAAGASQNGQLGIISGLPDCESCNRFIEGFSLGARSIRPTIQIEVAYLADSGETNGFGDPATARAFAEAFINVHEPDVLAAVAGASSRGIIEAACDAGDVLAVGTDIDVASAYPDLANCVLTSVVKDYAGAARDAVISVAEEFDTQRIMGLRNGGVSLRADSVDWAPVPWLPVDLAARVESARENIEADLLETCPTLCGGSGEPGASPGPEASPSGDGG